MTVAPGAVGDVLLLAIETKYPGTPAIAGTGVAGGGVSTWNKVLSYASRDGLHGQALWWGVVTSTGSKTLTASFNSAATKGNSASATSLDVQEFRSSRGAATVWSIDGSGQGRYRCRDQVPDLSDAHTVLGYRCLLRLSRG